MGRLLSRQGFTPPTKRAHVEVDGDRMMASKTSDYLGVTRAFVALPTALWANVHPPGGLSIST